MDKFEIKTVFKHMEYDRKFDHSNMANVNDILYASPMQGVMEQIQEVIHESDLAHDDFIKECIVSVGIDPDALKATAELNVRLQKELHVARAMAVQKVEWISVEERLPEEGKYVIVWVGSVQVARIEKGITEEERQKMKNGEVEDRIEYGWSQSTGCIPLKRSNLYKACDVHGNNRVPYCWKANGGPMEWFGQNVTHWMPLPEPPEDKR